MAKKTLISDILHYPISLTEIERRIIATPIFNRLHNVKQNSTAFLTFPTLNHPRFSHSLGAMHLSGELFYYGLLNASPENYGRFIQTINRILCKIEEKFNANHFPQSLNNKTIPEPRDRKPQEICLRSPTLVPYVPYFLSESQQVIFLIAIQAVRLVSLVHDLGHPPFSHVTEFSLEQIFEHLFAKKDQGAELTEKEEEFCRLLSRGSSDNPHIPLHEALTQNLFEQLSAEASEYLLSTKIDPTALLATWLVLELAKSILAADLLTSAAFDEDALATLKSLHAIIASDFDADRLDYVQRDLLLSGIRENGFRPQRLIELFELTYIPDDKQGTITSQAVPAFLPHVRAIRSLEEFFASRYDLYRGVIFHHHVLKTDGILQEVVRKTALKWLGSNDDEESPMATSQSQNQLLTGDKSDIKWLWKIFENDHLAGTGVRNGRYLQWDDHWLMSLLRQRYLELRELDHEATNSKPDDLILFRQLEDLVASKQNYISVIKRLEDFHEIDFAFLNYIFENANFSKFKEKISSFSFSPEKSMRSHEKNWVAAFQEKIKTFSVERSKNISNGAVAAADKYLAAISLRANILPAIKDDFCKQAKLLDVLFVRKQISPGFDKNFMIQTTNGVQKFSDYSNLAKEILGRSDKMPAFYLYVLPEDPNALIDKAKIRKLIGELLGSELLKIVTLPPKSSGGFFQKLFKKI